MRSCRWGPGWAWSAWAARGSFHLGVERAVAAAAAEVPERPPQSLAPSIRRQDTLWIPVAGSCGCGSAMAVNPSLNDSRCYTMPPRAGAGAEDSHEGTGSVWESDTAEFRDWDMVVQRSN